LLARFLASSIAVANRAAASSLEIAMGLLLAVDLEALRGQSMRLFRRGLLLLLLISLLLLIL